MSFIFGYLIDPFAATISRVELAVDDEGSTLAALYQHIGCQTVECIKLDSSHDLWTDEEAWLSEQRAAIGTIKAEDGTLIGGKAIVLSVDEATGNSKSPMFSMAEIAKQFIAMQPIITANFSSTSYNLGDQFNHISTPQFTVSLKPQPFTVAE